MPARNMGSLVALPANPATGKFVMMSPFSGPKGSPFDRDQAGNASTGALSTGIGYGANKVTNVSTGTSPFTAIGAIKAAGFDDDDTVGITLPNGVASTTAILTAIGGGKSIITPGPGNTGLGVSTVSPYVAQPLLGFGAGSSRDAGAGPAFTGFATKMVTATGAVADGAAIEAGFTNRTGVAMVNTQSAFGSATAASPAVT